METSTIAKTDDNEDIAILEETKKTLKAASILLNYLVAKQVGSDKAVKLSSEEFVLQQQSSSNKKKLDSAFIRDLSYKLRGSLTPILGWTRLLLTQEMDAANTAKALSSIMRNAELQLKIIEELEDELEVPDVMAIGTECSRN